MCIICRNFVDDTCITCNSIKSIKTEIKENNQLNAKLIKDIENIITLVDHKCDSTDTDIICRDCPDLTEIKDLPIRIRDLQVINCPNLKRIISVSLTSIFCSNSPKLIELNVPNAVSLHYNGCNNVLEPPIFNEFCMLNRENYTNYYLTVENRLKVAIVKKAINNMKRLFRCKKYFKSLEFIEWSHYPNRIGGRLTKFKFANFVQTIC
jgi:hypothetical protein